MDETHVYRTKTECTLCAFPKLVQLSFLSNTPIANQFETQRNDALNQDLIPLDIVMCESCSHIQIGTLVNREILFSNYPYLSNSNISSATRLRNLASRFTLDFELNNNAFVLEIGSNDGFLLEEFAKSGCKVLGVDPAVTPTAISRDKNVDCIADYFSLTLAKKLRTTYSEPTLIIANNVLAHTHELRDIFDGIQLLMSAKSILIMEFSYAIDIYEKLLFDTIYHEHISYHTLSPLLKFLKNYGLKVFRFERFDAHGGSARVFIIKSENTKNIEASVGIALDYESQIGIHMPENWQLFNSRIELLKANIHNEISVMKKAGKRIVGYGVPAKFSTLFFSLNLNQNDFDFMVDDNSLKVGKYAPGTNLEIRKTSDLLETTPDCLILFSWNYKEELIKKIKEIGLVKETIIVPLPNFEVHKIRG